MQWRGHPLFIPHYLEEAQQALQIFLKEKLALFGDYQDAIQKDDSFFFIAYYLQS